MRPGSAQMIQFPASAFQPPSASAIAMGFASRMRPTFAGVDFRQFPWISGPPSVPLLPPHVLRQRHDGSRHAGATAHNRVSL